MVSFFPFLVSKQKNSSKAPAFGDQNNTKQGLRQSLRLYPSVEEWGEKRSELAKSRRKCRVTCDWLCWPHNTKTMPDAQSAGLWVGQMETPLLGIVVTMEREDFICWFPDSHWSKMVPWGFSSPSIQAVNLPLQAVVGQPSSMAPAIWQGASCESASGGQSQCPCRCPQRPGPGLQSHCGSCVVGTVELCQSWPLAVTLEETVWRWWQR